MKNFLIVVAALAVACKSVPTPKPTIVLRGGGLPDVEQLDCAKLEGDKLEICDLKNRVAREKALRQETEDKLAAKPAESKPVPAAPPAGPVIAQVPLMDQYGCAAGYQYDPVSLGCFTYAPGAINSDGTIVGDKKFYQPTSIMPRGSDPGIHIDTLEGAVGFQHLNGAVACFYRDGNYVPFQGGRGVYLNEGSTKGVPFVCADLEKTVVRWQDIEGSETARMVVAIPTGRKFAGYPLYKPSSYMPREYPGWDGPQYAQYHGF